METWAKGAVEKILIMLKVSMSEAEDDPASERGQRAGLSDGTKQTRVKPKAGCVAASKKSKSVNGLRGCGEAFHLHTMAFFPPIH